MCKKAIYRNKFEWHFTEHFLIVSINITSSSGFSDQSMLYCTTPSVFFLNRPSSVDSPWWELNARGTDLTSRCVSMLISRAGSGHPPLCVTSTNSKNLCFLFIETFECRCKPNHSVGSAIRSESEVVFRMIPSPPRPRRSGYHTINVKIKLLYICVCQSLDKFHH